MADTVDLRNEDRLPWLETVEPDEPESSGIGRVLALVLLGLAVLALIIFGIYQLQRAPSDGEGELIAAQEGDYKIKPDEPGGLKVKGEGATAVATSDGKPGNGAIDLKAVPEAPVDGRRAAQPLPAGSAGGRNAVAQVPASGGKLVAGKPLTGTRQVASPGAASGGSLVQLGAYPTEAVANAAWTGFTRRFAYLTPLGKSVQPVASGGRTLYRLRVNAGGANQAADICGRLKVAGESCFVAS